MQDLNFFNSIDELFLSVHTIESNIKTIISVDNYSPAGLKLLKKLIILCTSASITLIQQDYLNDTLALLKTADKADSELSRYGNSGLNWQGRLIMPNILAFVYFKQQRYTDSLKFLFNIHILIEEIKDSGLPVHLHLRNLTNILTFMVLWKLNRIDESEKYINSVLQSGMNTIREKNLYCLASVCKAGIAAKRDKDYMFAVTICNEALKKVENEEVRGDLVEDVMKALYYESRAGIDSQEYKNKSSEDWLVSQSFITIFYVTCFIPLMTQTLVIVTESSLKNQKDSVTKEPDLGVLMSKRPNFSASRTKADVKKPRKKMSLDVSSYARKDQNIKDEDEFLQYLKLELPDRGMFKNKKVKKNENNSHNNDRRMLMTQQGPKKEYYLQANDRNALMSQQGPKKDFYSHNAERSALMSQQEAKREFYIQNSDRSPILPNPKQKNNFYIQNPHRGLMMSQQGPKSIFYMQNKRSSLTPQQGPKMDFMQNSDRSSLTSQQGPKSDFNIQNDERGLLTSQKSPRNEFNIQIPDRTMLMSQQGYANDFNLQLTDRRMLISQREGKQDLNNSALSKYKKKKGNQLKEKLPNLSLLHTNGRYMVGKMYNEGSRISYFSPKVDGTKKNRGFKIPLKDKTLNKSVD
ncbi:hypothetical protein SteCoe_10691 [Stentor coeruleus]|uniref:Uncharacterized protein n=1 Tax=Stentor coeruleus TaxID=5963 RepID=A0A1R2CEZ3_9CILI|nr:hypothetical protein SteCoe_10691 [Stentor coeruleus]